MNKEHLETDLTIKTSYKIGHIFTVDTPSNCPIIRWQGSRSMGEIDQESRSTHNFNAQRVSSIRTAQLYFYVYMTINSLNIIEKWHQRLGCKF